jgi:hypothetical protein
MGPSRYCHYRHWRVVAGGRDEGESWTKVTNSGLWVTEPIQTHRTKKVQKPIVLYPPTTEHPVQTQLIAGVTPVAGSASGGLVVA